MYFKGFTLVALVVLAAGLAEGKKRALVGERSISSPVGCRAAANTTSCPAGLRPVPLRKFASTLCTPCAADNLDSFCSAASSTITCWVPSASGAFTTHSAFCDASKPKCADCGSPSSPFVAQLEPCTAGVGQPSSATGLACSVVLSVSIAAAAALL
jgi:hypothetical protein